MADSERDNFPTSGGTPPTPTAPIPTPTSTGSFFSVSKPSVWLAVGATMILALMASALAFHVIPKDNMDLFKTLMTGMLLYWGVMVRDVYHGEGR